MQQFIWLLKEWKKKILSIYDAAAEGVIALQEKMGWYEEPKLSVYTEKWDEILGEWISLPKK